MRQGGYNCSFCGSSDLIWDDSRGVIVCANCAAVLDIIYDYRMPYIEPHRPKSTFNKDIFFKKIEIKEISKILKRTQYIRLKGNLMLDFHGKDRKVKIYTTDSIMALNALNSDRNVVKIYNYLENKGIFSGLKYRTRVLLTYYLIYNGDEKKLKKLFKSPNLKLGNIKKLAKRVPLSVKVEIKHIING
ncbi:MAG: hypothetical protein QXF16_06305 [Metallosphaera sp.]